MPKSTTAAPPTRLRRSSVARKDSDDISFDSTHAREIELKRSRGEISCAECRRLKIRCDKTIPCQSCQRRGCAALCPNGSLATGQGTRFVLAATEHLHRRVAKMNDRMRQLEDALAIAHARYSDEPHPLLTDDQESTPASQDDMSPFPELASSISPETIDAFGTLSVSDHGVSRFFGPTGGTEYLLFSDCDTAATSSNGSKTPESRRTSHSPSISPEVLRFSSAFPFTPMGPPDAVRELIGSHLPPYERACQLSESYLEYAGWIFKGVARDQLIDEMIPFFYNRASPDPAAPVVDYSGDHDLGLLLAIFAIGALVDLKQEPVNAESDHFFQLAKAALSITPILERPALATVQALQLFSIYIAMVSNEPGENAMSMESSWGMIALSSHVAHNIGLHRDSSRWGLPATLVNRRRSLFWNIFIADSWQSLTTGRPPLFSRKYIDSKYPELEEDNPADDQPRNDFQTWSTRFAFECVAEVAARTLGAETPTYATIIDLDRRVRNFPIPSDVLAMLEDLQPATDSGPPPLAASMARFVISHSREVILLYIHRSFFAQAIIDSPSNPLRSAYAPSFLAAYRASCTILKVIRDQFAVYPALCARFWSIWTFAFSATVVFGTVATRGPRSPLAPAAIVQLEQAVELFSQAAKYSGRAARALPVVIKLREKAHGALAAGQRDDSAEGALWSVKSEEFEDELEIFAGRTKLVDSKRRSQSPASVPTPLPPQHLYAGPQSQQTFDQRSSPSRAAPVVHTGDQWAPYQGQPFPSTYADSQAGPASSSSSYQHVTYEQHPPHHSYSWPQPQQALHRHSLPPPPAPQYHADRQMELQYTSQQLLSESPDSYHEQMYAAAPQLPQVPHNAYAPPAELADLGLASRDSRLDERWTSFVQESGFLEGIHYRTS
ncbi:fungal-specific transcription factor domain-containing protein [Amylocystis lapponica]|nr:fungal-specific transcription factor domain-containing protein [Amylocystis lapponica]